MFRRKIKYLHGIFVFNCQFVTCNFEFVDKELPFGCRDVRIHKTGNAKLKNKVANYYKYYMKKIPMYFQVVFLIIDKIIFPQPSICAPKSAIVLT